MAFNDFTNGAGGNTWNTAGNWSQGTIPTTTDTHTVRILAVACTMSASRSCNHLDLSGQSATLTMSTFTLTVAGDISLEIGRAHV